MRRCALVACAALGWGAVRAESPAMVTGLEWKDLPALPPGRGEAVQPGVAGPFAGASHGALIVAGGANFPGKPPWEGGTKAWKDDVFVFLPGRGWSLAAAKLPHPMGYGVSFTVPEGVICAGGCDGSKCYADVFLLRWNAEREEVETQALAPLPAPLAMMGGAQAGSVLYLAGGQHEAAGAKPTRVLWALDLAGKEGASGTWKELPALPGPPRVVPVVAGQAGRLFVFSGRVQAEGQPTTLLTDGYSFDGASGQWRPLRDIGRCLMAGVAFPAGRSEIVAIGGDRGDLFMRLEGLDRRAAAARQAGNAADADAALQEKREIYLHHPGFGREILAYDVPTDRWRVVGDAPEATQVTTLAVPWDGGWALPNGEVRPAVRTPRVVWVKPKEAAP